MLFSNDLQAGKVVMYIIGMIGMVPLLVLGAKGQLTRNDHYRDRRNAAFVRAGVLGEHGYLHRKINTFGITNVAPGMLHDDIILWKHFPRHLSPVNSPLKGQWRGALMSSMICVWINGWVNNHEAGDLRRHRAHYDVLAMNSFEPSDGMWWHGYVSTLIQVMACCLMAISTNHHWGLEALFLSCICYRKNLQSSCHNDTVKRKYYLHLWWKPNGHRRFLITNGQAIRSFHAFCCNPVE